MAVRLVEQQGGVRFAVKVVPGASRDRIVGELGEALKVAVSAPASGGAANAALIALLAGAMGVPSARVSIVRGHTSARKELFVAGLRAADVAPRFHLGSQ